MRTAIAIMSALLLLGVITVCPLLACPLKADSGITSNSCCHKSYSRPPAPCPRPAIQNCPYVMLERGKTAPVIAQTLTAGLVDKSPESRLPDQFSLVQVQGTIADSTRLFLRIRVLLI